MADLRATPMVNPVMGLLADRLKKVQQFGAKPFGYENPPVEMLMNLLGVPAVQQTMERMAYGEPLTTGRGMTTKPRAEAVEAAMAVAPVAGLLGKATKGLPEGASVKNVGEDLLSYRGSHTAPDSSFGAPLYDLTGGGQMYPADVYSSKAAQIYGGGMPYDQKAFSIAQQYKDKPNALVTIYRAVPKDISNSEKLATLEKQMAAYMKRGTLPKDAENYSSGSKWYDAAYEKREQLRKMPDEPTSDINTINAGDWVTLTREYAKDHGESALKGEYKILSKKVKAKEVFTNADSIHEFGYQPEVTKPSKVVAPQQEALDTAQRNAALPIEEGGLGLPKDNTPEMRAKAMGYDVPAYRGSTAIETSHTNPIWWTEDPSNANTYAEHMVKPPIGQPDPYAGNVMPLLVKIENEKQFEKFNAGGVPLDPFSGFSNDIQTGLRRYPKNVLTGQLGGKVWEAVSIPENVRSRFAAFDPMRRNEPDILAGVLPLALLADEEQRKKIYELMPSLLGQ